MGKKRPGKLSAVAASEDSTTDARIEEFCRGLCTRLGGEAEVSKQIWLLSELRMPQLRAIAAQEAATADLVIVAVHHSAGLPAELQSWLDLWPTTKRKCPPLLLALFDPVHSGVSAGLRAGLEDFARRGGMEFLVQSEEGSTDI